MTFMPDAHRPKDADEAGCWAGGNFACDAPATEPLGLCDRHRAEVTSDAPRPEPTTFADRVVALQVQVNDLVSEMMSEMEPALRRIVVQFADDPTEDA